MVKYHHGDLRNTLLTIATELLAADGIQALSLRKIAQKAGVSHNAPYMHFADKEAVLVAIATEGFRLLSLDVEAAMALAETSARQQLLAACNAYVRFAIDRAAHLQVMFRSIDVTKYPDLAAVSQASLHRLSELVKSGMERGEFRAGDPAEMTIAIWTMVHGIATLSVAYQPTLLLPRDSIEDIVVGSIGHLLDGIGCCHRE
jgi:AcrR family transcriptional regulator